MWRRVFSLLVLAACGYSSAARPGGEPPDAGDAVADASIDPAIAVTVTVMRDGAPQSGVAVYFQSSHLGPSTERSTDATGSASAAIELMPYNPASVTVVNPFGPLDATTDELFSYNTVKPGDRIMVEREAPPSRPVGFTLIAPGDSPDAIRYQLHTNCGTSELAAAAAGAVGGEITLHGCGATVDMLVETFDASGASRSWLYQADVAIHDGGSVALSGAYQPSHPKTFSYHTAPIDRPQLEIHARLMTAKGVVFDSPAMILPVSFMNEFPSLTTMLPSLPGAVAVSETVYQSGDDGLEHMVDWGPDSEHYMLELEPFGSYLEQYYSPPTLMNGGVEYVWTGGTVTADYMRATLSVSRPGDRSWRWHFASSMLNGGGGTQPWPHIPSDIHLYDLQAGDVWSISEATIVNMAGGYDTIRPRALSIASPVSQVSGPSGRIVYETLLPQ